jgi:hypothetical protein
METCQQKRQNSLYLSYAKELRLALETRAKFDLATAQASKGGNLSEEAQEARNLQNDMQARMLRNMSNLSSYEHKVHAGILAKLMEGDKNKIVGLVYPDAVSNEAPQVTHTTTGTEILSTRPLKRTKKVMSDTISEPSKEETKEDESDIPMTVRPVTGIEIPWTRNPDKNDIPRGRR